ncbi:MAG TPA: hypothetical protein VJ860_15230 [Polyangia bacterium]|jgi:hypothetical protein|nr:hypothetical protein [Polyangia bacterium]
MPRIAVTTALLAIGFATCASASKSPAASTGQVAPVVRPDRPSTEAPKAQAAVPPLAPPAMPLAAGRCNETFDCDDTCDLAPSGSRWDCQQRKCVLKALPNLSPQPEPTDVSPAAPAAGKAKAKKSAKQRT